ncbi:hypothetical protein [Hymenobacter lapidarius]|nr:hypothetical protein [Hymenobacter lapidarius]
MCDFVNFRNKAREAFSTLIVSVLMFEKGSGRGGEVTYYRVKVAGPAIGPDPMSATAASAQAAIDALIRQVGQARRQVSEARQQQQLSRRALTYA